MKLTEDKPIEEGWYWIKRQYENEPMIVKVRKYSGEMCILNRTIPDNCLWAGPIKEPNPQN